jgi:hypothetical protein
VRPCCSQPTSNGRKAKGQPLIIRKRMMARALAFATLAQLQWKRGQHDSRTVRTPCPPRTLRALGLYDVSAALWSISDRPQRSVANVYPMP